jgi:hypothetical protein
MTYRGIVSNGMIILPQGAELPSGTEVLISPVKGETAAKGTSIWEKLQQAAATAASLPTTLPEDLAENHDHYLHGQAKRS